MDDSQSIECSLELYNQLLTFILCACCVPNEPPTEVDSASGADEEVEEPIEDNAAAGLGIGGKEKLNWLTPAAGAAVVVVLNAGGGGALASFEKSNAGAAVANDDVIGVLDGPVDDEAKPGKLNASGAMAGAAFCRCVCE